MTQALRLAAKGQGKTSPNPMVGAVVVSKGRIVGQAYHHAAGQPHAEVLALSQAGSLARGATLYVTVEPCLMCVGAFVHARIGTVVYGAPEPRTGALVSTVRGGELPGHNHRFEAVGGVRDGECRALMQEVFRARRKKDGAEDGAGLPADG